MRSVIITLLLLFSFSANAGTYVVIDQNGGAQNVIEWDGTSPHVLLPGLRALPVTQELLDSYATKHPVPPAIPPSTTVLSAAAFQARFTPAEQAAIWAAANKDITGKIGAGLTRGLTSASINLFDPAVADWLNALVTAGAITADRVPILLKAP